MSAVPRGGGGTEPWSEVGKMKKQLRPAKSKGRKTMECEMLAANSLPSETFKLSSE